MIDLNSLNSYAKEFPKETNELKYLIAVFNDIKNHYSIMRNSMESELKGLEAFFKSNISHSKNFMNEISSLNFYENETPNVNEDKDHPIILNISMSFGNQFDLNGRIFFDELEELNGKINNNLSEFNEEINSLYKYLIENINISFKEISANRVKYKYAAIKCEKLFKELESSIIQRKDEKLSEKIFNSFSEFEENFSQLLIIYDDVKKGEIWNDESLNNIFNNILKLAINSLNHFFENFNLFTNFKANLIEKILQTLSITNESISALEMGVDYSFIIPYELEIKHLYENSEGIINHLNSQTHTISFKKKVLLIYNRFISDIIKGTENLIFNFQKICKTNYNNKIDILVNKSYSYLNTTSVSKLFDFLKSVFDLYTKKLQEVNKHMTSSLLISIETISKDLLNEENMVVNLNSKFSKEFLNYKNDLNKFLIRKEKIIGNILSKDEVSSNNNGSKSEKFDKNDKYDKTDNKLYILKSEESAVNESITDLNNKYKKYIEDFISNDKITSSLVPSRDFGENYREGIVSFTSQLEKIYSQLNDYIKLKDQITSGDFKEDIKNIFEVFIKEYMTLGANEKLEDFIFKMYDEITNLINCYNEDSIPIINYNTECDYKDEEFEEIIIINNNNYNKISEYKFLFINKEDLVTSPKDYRKEYDKLFKGEEYNQLKEKFASNFKNKAYRKSSVYCPPALLENKLISLELDENIVDNFNCSFYDHDKNLFVLGKLYLTNKKIVFEPKMNTQSNVNGSNKSFIEVSKKDLSSIFIVHDNAIRIISKNSENLKFLFIIYSSVAQVINRIKIIFKIDDINNIIIESQENYECVNTVRERVPLLSEENLNNVNELSQEFCDGLIKTCENVFEFQVEDVNQMLSQTNFIETLKEFNKNRINYYTDNNLVRRNFNACFVKSANVANSADVPICLIYKYIYDNETVCVNKDLNFSKNFILSQMEISKDYSINFNYMPLDYENNNNNFNFKNIVPKYYLEPFNYTLPLLAKLEKTELQEFLENLDLAFPKESMLQYQYKYTHPMKKKFMGPSKLDMNDEYKFFFISPMCFIVEITTYLAGFMLMDTFFTVAQYKYETELNYDSRKNKICYKTNVTASFAIEFVKENWFRNKIESNGMADNEVHIKEFILVNIAKVIHEKYQEFSEKEIKLKSLIVNQKGKGKAIEGEIKDQTGKSNEKEDLQIKLASDIKYQIDPSQKIGNYEDIKENKKEEIKELEDGKNNIAISTNKSIINDISIAVIPIFVITCFLLTHIFGNVARDFILYFYMAFSLYLLLKLCNQYLTLEAKVNNLNNIKILNCKKI